MKDRVEEKIESVESICKQLELDLTMLKIATVAQFVVLACILIAYAVGNSSVLKLIADLFKG